MAHTSHEIGHKGQPTEPRSEILSVEEVRELEELDKRSNYDFKWLRRNSRGAAYNSYSLFSHFPACSFDWGDSGFAGSSNYGGELLYLSAPSCKHGLVLARGNFSTSHYASLSRAQIVFGGPATFGLEVSRAQFVYDPSQKDSLKAKRGSSYRLGALIERGCFNYRWPFNEYYLDANVEEENEAVDSTGPSDHTDGETGAKASTSSPAGRPAHLGTCQMFSFAKDGYFYQVLRVQEDSSFKTKPKVPDLSGPQQTEQKDTEQKQIVLTMGGPVWFHTFHAEDRLHDHLLNDRGQARPVHGSQGRVKTDDLEGATEANTDIVKDRSPVCASSPARDGDDAEYEMIKYWDCTRKIGLEAMVYKVSKAGRLKKLPLFVSNVEADSGPNSLQSDNKTRAYNAVVPFDDDDQIAGHRCQVFMAAIRLYEDHEQEEPTKWMPPPSSQDIYEFIGASPSSLKATGALWQTVSNKSLTGTSSGLNIDEASLIGRSLEKILQVDIAPVTFQDDVGTKHAGTKECEKGKPLPSSGGQHSDKERRPTGEVEPSAALVSNIYIRANVDLKSMFWKVRFLVNTHQFLQVLSKFGEGLHQTKNENGINNTAEDNPRGEVRNENGSVSSEEHTKTPHYLLLPDVDSAELSKMVEFQRSRLQECLRSIIRYIVKALLVPPSGMPPNIMPDNHIPGETNYYYVMMTIWYVARYFPRDSSSDWSRLWDYTRSIRKSLNLSAPSPLSSNGRLPPDNWSFQVTDKEKVSLLQWYHYGSILNLCNQGILDESWKDGPDLKWRVLRLAKAAKVTAASKLCSRLQYAADDEIIDRLSFVSDELGLEYLPDGQVGYVAMSAVKRVKSRDHTRLINPGWLPVGEEGPTSGPWEIHALCHHSRLIVLVLEKRAGQDHRTKQHTKEEADTVKQRIYGFLNAEGTLVPCWERAHAKARKGWLRSEATSVVATTLLLIQKKRIWDRINEPRAPASLSHSLSPPDANMSLRRMESITRDKSDFDSFDKNTNETGQLPPVAWETFRPPRLYHPKGFLNSLEDTPGLYKTDQLIKASIPASLSGFITAARDVVIPFTHKTLEEAVKGSLWLWDITATTPRQEEQGATWGIRPLHSDSDQAERERGDTGEEKQSRLGWVLYDNLVDQEVQHRFLTITDLKQPKKQDLLDHLVYILHSESATCVGNHLLSFSRFSMHTGETWSAYITLRYWLAPDPTKENSERAQSTFLLDHRPIIRPPAPLKNNHADENIIFLPEVASLVISTNAFGDFSKCTVISDLLTRQVMDKIVRSAREVWEKFIHQPQTARCLIFLLILGSLAQEITTKYQNVLEKISALQDQHRVDIPIEVEYSGEDKIQNNVNNVWFALWSLNTLKKLQNSFQASVSSLMDAKEQLVEQISYGPGKRSLALERMCQEYLREFESTCLQFTAMYANLERKIDLASQNKEDAFAILAMSDSAASLHQNKFSLQQNEISISQNDSIGRLTHLTIGYLPVGLMASIFAIPGTQNVIFDGMGRGWFVGTIIILSLITWVVASYIGHILHFFQYPPPAASQHKKPDLSKVHFNLWTWLTSVRERQRKDNTNV